MNVKFQDSEVKEDQAFTFTEEEKGTHEEGYLHPQIFLTNELDPRLLENFDTTRGFLLVRVPKDQVVSGKIIPVLSTLRQLIASPKIARSFREKVAISFDGYDYDPRELYQIPEVRAYIRKLDAQFPHWLYFLSKHLQGLNLILVCLLPTYWQEQTKQKIISIKMNKILERRWKPALKQIIDFAGLPYGLNEEIIERSMNYFSCPSDFIMKVNFNDSEVKEEQADPLKLWLLISKRQVESGDVTDVVGALNMLIQSPEMVELHKENVTILFTDYYKQGEVWKIPEVRAYVRKLDEQFPYWLYFFSKQYTGLYEILMCLIPSYWENQTSQEIIMQKTKSILKRWIAAMRQIIDFVGLPYAVHKEITERSIQYVNYPFDFIRSPAELNVEVFNM